MRIELAGLKGVPRRRIWVIIAGLLVIALLVPHTVHSQLGLDPCCIATAIGLSTLNLLTGNMLSTPLGELVQLKDEFLQYQQLVIWTKESIALGKGFVGQVQGLINSIKSLLQQVTKSATLPLPQALEGVTLSKDSSKVPQIDMADAAAKAALKQALKLDAIVEQELNGLAQLNDAIGKAAPGTAPMLEVDAAAWLVRANAYTQAGMAELTKLQGLSLADETAELKRNLTRSVNDRNTITGMTSQR
jgi:hypothetical protein